MVTCPQRKIYQSHRQGSVLLFSHWSLVAHPTSDWLIMFQGAVISGSLHHKTITLLHILMVTKNQANGEMFPWPEQTLDKTPRGQYLNTYYKRTHKSQRDPSKVDVNWTRDHPDQGLGSS